MSGSGEHEDGKRIGGPPALPEGYGKPLAPVTAAERIFSLDVLRGFALLGILIANMLYFSQPLEPDGFRNGLWLGPPDWWADWITVFLVEGKFYPLFSFLFGLGFSMQMDRASSRGLDFKTTYRRRLFILMGFGLAHGILLWEGDVLLPYAVCGFALPLFRNRKPLTILIWAVGLIVLPSLLILGCGLLLLMFSGHPEFARAMQESMTEDPETTRELIEAFVTGGYADAVSYRLGELIPTILLTMVFAPAFLGLFLMGMLAGRKRIIVEVANHRRSLVTILMVCGAVGLVGNFLGAWVTMSGSANGDFGLMLVGSGMVSIFGPVLTAAYIAGIVLLIHQRPSLAILPSIASVGRMALTHYLTQSAVATTVFYGYGLGLGGNTGRLGTIGIALLIYAAQVVFSVFWLNHFRYGPAEWLWRSLTYGTRQPMLRRSRS
jgi:uncharacterized protein